MTSGIAVRRCASCGAEQAAEVVDGQRCHECGRILGLAPLPVPRGPVGFCPVHPDLAVTGVCAQCGRYTCTACDVSVGGLRYCRDCRVRHRRTFTAPAAWEERREIGRWRAWLRTTSQVTGQPGTFFARLQSAGGLGGALIFALLGAFLLNSGRMALGFFRLLVSSLTLLVDPLLHGASSIDVSLAIYVGLRLLYLLASPLLVLLLFILVAALQHLALRLVDAGAEHGIEATLKVALYGFALGWLGVVPWLGPAIFPIWWTAVMVIGTAQVHGRSTTRTAVVIVPSLLLLLAPVASCFAAGMLGVLAA